MTFNRMGTVPLPLALHLASHTVLGLFCFFAGVLNLVDPVKIPQGILFLLVCGFSWGYVFGILMARREVVVLGYVASAVFLLAGIVGAARFGFDWRLTVWRRPEPSTCVMAGTTARLSGLTGYTWSMNGSGTAPTK